MSPSYEEREAAIRAMSTAAIEKMVEAFPGVKNMTKEELADVAFMQQVLGRRRHFRDQIITRNDKIMKILELHFGTSTWVHSIADEIANELDAEDHRIQE